MEAEQSEEQVLDDAALAFVVPKSPLDYPRYCYSIAL